MWSSFGVLPSSGYLRGSGKIQDEYCGFCSDYVTLDILPILFMTLMKKTSVINGFTFVCLGLMYLHGVDGVVLLTSLNIDLQSALEQFAADCEARGMRDDKGYGYQPEKGRMPLGK